MRDEVEQGQKPPFMAVTESQQGTDGWETDKTFPAAGREVSQAHTTPQERITKSIPEYNDASHSSKSDKCRPDLWADEAT